MVNSCYCILLVSIILPRHSLLRLIRVFLTLQKCWGGDRARLYSIEQGEDGSRLFRLVPPHPIPISYPALVEVIIVNFLYSKTLLFKQTYQYWLILLYATWLSTSILLCVMLWDFSFCCDIVLLNTLIILISFC